MGICEVDLLRNEDNQDLSNNKIFSTEQLKNTLYMEGYNLILPPSWNAFDKARVIVFAKEDIKAKLICPDHDDAYIQNILLEIGYGKAKTHFVSFYYREWKSCITHDDSDEAQMIYLKKTPQHLE